MIDYVTLRHHINIPTHYFSQMKWKRSQTEDGQFFRWHTFRRVKLRYYEDTQTFTISGKLLMFLYDTQVQNLDDIYGARHDLFTEELNAALNHLFRSPILDVREFTVSRIDYCFNVEIPYVKAYTDFMERAFQMTDTGTRVDYTHEHGLSGSIYIRTASDYRDNSNKNYTLNFYDKSAQLQDLIAQGAYFSEADQILAQDVLRLEVQCGYQMIKRLTKKFGISNTFGEMLDFRIAYEAILSAYCLNLRGTETADYFTYSEAKELLTGQRKAQDHRSQVRLRSKSGEKGWCLSPLLSPEKRFPDQFSEPHEAPEGKADETESHIDQFHRTIIFHTFNVENHRDFLWFFDILIQQLK